MARSSRDPGQMPTRRQGAVLRDLAVRPMTADALGLRRADVLWRMEERSWVTSSGMLRDRAGERWTITAAGRAALDRWEATP